MNSQTTQVKLEPTICGLIARQGLAHPEQTAIIDGETYIDYQTLLQRASEVAGELQHRGVAPGSLVGVCMHRTWELVAVLLGVMQAGCAYVPLDPAYPQDRVRYMLENSRAAAAIVDNENTAALCSNVPELILISEVGTHVDSTVRPTGHDLAYVIYTSGSTGRPKGVAVEHRNVVAMHQEMRQRYTTEELEGVFAGASVCFDTSVMEIMGTLSLGGTIILAQNALELTQLPAAHKLRMVVMVASAMQAILATDSLPEGIRCLVFGGEALKRSLVEQVYALRPDMRILNAYGPTEDTVYATMAEIKPGTQVVTIGKSVPSSRAYVLDENLQPVPTGEPGELHLAGSKLARGYLYDEAKTKERFIEREATEQIPDVRLYKTGDLCRYTESGEIEFLGRVDQQVKVRGYRIELGEIESTLEGMPGVDAAAAAAVDGGIGQKMLVVYVVSKHTAVTEATVKDYLAERLPKYMVPHLVKHLPELPLLPNDKLDRKKLMSMEAKAAPAKAQDSAQPSEVLPIIQREVASLLSLSDPAQVAPDRAFDSHGLDSLTTLELSSRLTKALGQKLPPHAIFNNPTPASLVQYIMQNGGGHATSSSAPIATDTLATFQTHIQSSHPTFQAAKATAWNANDKSVLVQEVLRLVNDQRRNPYSKVLRTGSATRGLVGDAYNDEEQEAIIWTTNLYLGLNRDAEVMAEAGKAVAQYGTGMGTSAAASGMTDHHLDFEKEFAELVGKPSACLFPTGYTANVGAVAGILGRNDLVVIDQLCHASIVDGARLCGAEVRTFKHNNAEDLEAILQSEASPYRTIMVVLEGVYSMGEGAAPVAKIVRTAKKYEALVLVDEAHSFGFYGERGAGICAAQGVTEQADFIMTTLSKSLGSLGGVVAASQEHVDLMKSSSRAYIFQASVSPADMAAALTSLRRIRTDDSLRERLWDNTRYMRGRFEEAGYDLGTGDGPIVTPHFADKDTLYAIVQGMYQRGVQTSAVTYPIVEPGRGRLRFICSAAHTKADIDKTLEALQAAEKEAVALVATSRETSQDTPASRAELEQWAKAFVNYLNDWITDAPTPNLTLSVQVTEAGEPITLVLQDGVVTLGAKPEAALPTCAMLLTEQRAVTALQTADVQSLLQTIAKGTCVLHGQVEPFIWLFARLQTQPKDSLVAEPQLEAMQD